ncbi:MAG: hypothetical protein PQJ46_05400 [Spirochaetales bacterium]|nr:hypothetical protein [Spirochaetales bacterium]
MLTEVKIFLEEFFQVELEAWNANLKPNLEIMNSKMEKMYSYCHDSLYNSLNIVVRDKLRSPSFYDDSPNYQHPRYLFKLSHYEHPKYGDLYLAYTSEPAIIYNDFLSINYCLFITKVEEEYKIISSHFVHTENLGNIHWRNKGVEDITFDNAGKLIEIERYIEPSNDDLDPEISQFSINEYNKNR